MNPFATGTSAGHAPRRSDGERTRERERAEHRGSNREDERRQRGGKTTRMEIYARIR